MKKLILILSVIFVLNKVASAQDRDKADIGTRIMSGAVSITNRATVPLTITLTAGQVRDTVRIRQYTKWVSGNYAMDPTVLVRSGATAFVKYKLLRGREYILFWNTSLKKYDVRVITD